MTHPTPERWMELLYNECSPSVRRDLNAHLAHCEECRARYSQYGSVSQVLHAWELPSAASAPVMLPWPRLVKWAAAAALFVSTGLAAQRWSSPPVDPAALRAEITAQVRHDLQESIREQIIEQVSNATDQATAASQARLDQLSAALATLRNEDKAAVLQSLNQLESQYLADLRALRQELETVAVMTDQSLRNTQRQLVQLAGYNQP